jgi:hypothetical protein
VPRNDPSWVRRGAGFLAGVLALLTSVGIALSAPLPKRESAYARALCFALAQNNGSPVYVYSGWACSSAGTEAGSPIFNVTVTITHFGIAHLWHWVVLDDGSVVKATRLR